MLYDPKWEIQTWRDVFSLEGLIAWLETMPAEETYNYHDCEGRCLLSQYLTVHGKHWSHDYHRIGSPSDRSTIAGTTPQTFGAALDRARKAAA